MKRFRGKSEPYKQRRNPTNFLQSGIEIPPLPPAPYPPQAGAPNDVDPVRLSTDPSTSMRRRPPASSLLEAVFLSLVEQVRLGAPQVDDLGTPVSVLLLLRALAAVVCVRDARASADGAPPLNSKEGGHRDTNQQLS